MPTWRGPRCYLQRKNIYPAILRTCQLVHQEAAAVLYGKNVFDFGNILDLPNYGASFAKHIGPYHASLIRILVAEASVASEALHSCEDIFSIDKSRISPFIAQATLAAEASLAAETSLTAETPLSPSTTYISKSRIAAIVAAFGIDFARLRMLAIHLQPRNEMYFDRKAARAIDAAEQWFKMRDVEMERVVDGIVEREKGWLRRAWFADVEGVCFEWVTSWVWARRPWFLYEGDCDD